MYYTNAEIGAIYSRTVKIIKSCRTVSQLTVAVKYASFFLKITPPTHRSAYASALRDKMKVQSAKIQWYYGLS